MRTAADELIMNELMSDRDPRFSYRRQMSSRGISEARRYTFKRLHVSRSVIDTNLGSRPQAEFDAKP